jgi:hypothetical protein
MTETAASPVTRWRPKATEVEAVRWDGTPAVFAVLAEWGAEPLAGSRPGGCLRVWGPRDGYVGALPGDWLVRERDARIPGVARYAPEEFEAAFHTPAGEEDACGLLMGQAQASRAGIPARRFERRTESPT